MLDMNKSSIFESFVAPVLSTVATIDEGMALVHVLENGVGVVQPSAGAANQRFAGVAIGRSATPTIVPIIENLPVPASGPYTASLSKTMNGSAIRVTHIDAAGARTLLAAGSATNANEYSISNGVITVNSSKASGTLEVSYRYAISLTEAIFKYNFQQNGTNNVSDIGTQGVGDSGVFYTDCFDVTSDFSTFSGAAPVCITANGQFTMTSSGNTSIEAIVVAVPGVNSPFLGLQLNNP